MENDVFVLCEYDYVRQLSPAFSNLGTSFIANQRPCPFPFTGALNPSTCFNLNAVQTVRQSYKAQVSFC